MKKLFLIIFLLGCDTPFYEKNIIFDSIGDDEFTNFNETEEATFSFETEETVLSSEVEEIVSSSETEDTLVQENTPDPKFVVRDKDGKTINAIVSPAYYELSLFKDIGDIECVFVSYLEQKPTNIYFNLKTGRPWDCKQSLVLENLRDSLYAFYSNEDCFGTVYGINPSQVVLANDTFYYTDITNYIKSPITYYYWDNKNELCQSNESQYEIIYPWLEVPISILFYFNNYPYSLSLEY